MYLEANNSAPRSDRRKPHRKGSVIRLLLVVFALGLPLASQAQIQSGETFTAHLTATGLEVLGATPGGEVAIFGVWRQRHVYWSEVGRVDERLLDDDGDGVVAWDLGKDLPPATVLFAVDLGSGQWRQLSPPSLKRRPLPSSSFALAEAKDALALDLPAVYGWVVRPAEGSWSFKARDGGPTDAAPSQDGALLFDLSNLESGEAGPAPVSRMAEGDRLFVIHPGSLAFTVLAVSGTQLVDGGSL